MPYIIKKFKDGYKVCKKYNQKKCFSKDPIPLENAKKQMKAIGMSGRGLCCSKPSRVSPADNYEPSSDSTDSTDSTEPTINVSQQNQQPEQEQSTYSHITSSNTQGYSDNELEGTGIQTFKDRLKNIGVSFKKYFNAVKQNAFSNGYDPELLKLSNKKGKKFNYNDVHFGSSDNNDYIIYRLLEKNKKIEKGEADKFRNAYLARATKIKGNWKNNKESPNNLAINLLWDFQ